MRQNMHKNDYIIFSYTHNLCLGTIDCFSE